MNCEERVAALKQIEASMQQLGRDYVRQAYRLDSSGARRAAAKLAILQNHVQDLRESEERGEI